MDAAGRMRIESELATEDECDRVNVLMEAHAETERQAKERERDGGGEAATADGGGRGGGRGGRRSRWRALAVDDLRKAGSCSPEPCFMSQHRRTLSPPASGAQCCLAAPRAADASSAYRRMLLRPSLAPRLDLTGLAGGDI